ncbi:MAG: type II secretion system F family protein [Bacteroidota bacterium]
MAKEKELPPSGASFWNKEINVFGNGFSSKAKEDFYAELSILLHSGINLKTAFDLISESQKKQKDKDRIHEISAEILAGNSLSDTLEKNENFSAYEYQAIRIGEQTGKLAKITEDLKNYFQRRNELKRQLISSLSYPILVLFLALAVVIFMLNFVVPLFDNIFRQNQVELPWITQQVVELSNFISGNGWELMLGFTLLIIGLKWVSKTDAYYRFIGKLKLRIPVLGRYLRRMYLVQFTQAMALLTHAKIPVVNGIHLVKQMIRFYPLEQTLDHIEKDILAGEKLYLSFGRHRLYDKKMIALLRVAEETNQTEYIFQKLYDQYRKELDHKGKIITSVFNFLLTFMVGLIVGIIVISMYLPMFKLSSAIG